MNNNTSILTENEIKEISKFKCDFIHSCKQLNDKEEFIFGLWLMKFKSKWINFETYYLVDNKMKKFEYMLNMYRVQKGV